jgi:CRP-like cAMP-binding protein
LKEEYLKNTPLFGALTDDEQRAIAKHMRLEQYGPDELLFIKNGEAETFYLIKEGWVKLSTAEHGPVVATLGAGSLLGETDFFSAQPHTMTARTAGEVMVWSINQTAMPSLLAERPRLGLHLGLALGRGIAQFYPELALRLASIPLLQDLSPRERSLVAPYLIPRQYAPGATIYRSGDQPTGLFFIEEGAIRLLGDTDDDYTELAAGETFGEMAVISHTPHSNTAQAATQTILWQLNPTDFGELIQKNPSIKTNLSRNLRARLSASDQAYAVALLGRISLFADLSRAILADIARMLLLRHVPAGEIIFSQGDPGDAMVIIDTGAVVADSAAAPGQMNHRFGDGDFLGESALLTGKTREFTAQAAANTNLWCLYRPDFDSLLVKYPQLSAALSQTLRERLHSADSFSAAPHLQKFAVAGGLTRSQLDELSARLQPRRYQGGSTIYFGAATAMKCTSSSRAGGVVGQRQPGQVLLETIGQGDYFGETALLSGDPGWVRPMPWSIPLSGC